MSKTDPNQLIEQALANSGEIDPAWRFDEDETATWKQFSAEIRELADAIHAGQSSKLASDAYQELIERSYRHAKELDAEWFITGTEQEGNVLYGDQARWANLAHGVWDLVEVLLEVRGDDLEHSPHAFSHGS